MARTKQKHHSRNKTVYNRQHTHTLDADQVNELLTPEKLQQIESRKLDPYLPGEGRFYCLICDKYFISQIAYDQHLKGGQHRLRLRDVKEGGFNPKDAYKVLGKGVDNGKKIQRPVEPQQQ